MDLVDEQHVARFQIGQDRREVTGLGNDWAGGRAEADDLTSDDDVANARRAGVREVKEETGISLERDDLAADTWETVAPMSTARYALAAEVLGGQLYAIGGIDDSGNNYLQSVERYTPATDTWEAVADLTGEDDSALFVQLPRTPGRKEAELMHQLCGPVDIAAHAQQAAANRGSSGSSQGRIAELEARVQELEAENAALRRRLGDAD